jgi:NifU-like protein involved in Fe-S cluster formation
MLCEAAASLLGRAAVGATLAEVAAARAGAAAMLASGAPPPREAWAELELFRQVHLVRSRHRCVLLPFDALGEALARARV